MVELRIWGRICTGVHGSCGRRARGSSSLWDQSGLPASFVLDRCHPRMSASTGLLRPFLSWGSMVSVAAFTVPRGTCISHSPQARCTPHNHWGLVHQSPSRAYCASTIRPAATTSPDPYRTVLTVPPHTPRIQHSHRLAFIGSCFTENIGERFSVNKWDTLVNPFGILYNPVSMAAGIRRILSGELYTKDDLGYHQGLYYRYDTDVGQKRGSNVVAI